MITFSWCETHHYDETIKALFLTSLSPDYISHSEIQEGRAINTHIWQKNLALQLQKDIDHAVSNDNVDVVMAIALQEENLLGVAFLHYTHAAIYYATLDDLMISTQARGMKLGSHFLDWIEKEIKQKGVSHFFLESGIRNKNAHHFFEKQGFTPISVTMMKEFKY